MKIKCLEQRTKSWSLKTDRLLYGSIFRFRLVSALRCNVTTVFNHLKKNNTNYGTINSNRPRRIMLLKLCH